MDHLRSNPNFVYGVNHARSLEEEGYTDERIRRNADRMLEGRNGAGRSHTSDYFYLAHGMIDYLHQRQQEGRR